MTPIVDISGYWSGTAADSSGQEAMFWQIALEGHNLTGTGGRSGGNSAAGGDHGLSVTGSLSGATLTFTVTWGSNCVRTITGTANVTASAITGTYSGSSCATMSNGMLALKRFDVTGTWSGGASELLPGVGPGRFSRTTTWQLTQNGESVTGSMSNPDPIGPNVPISGTFSDTSSTLTYSTTFAVANGRGGTCQETINGTAKLGLAFAATVLPAPSAVLAGPYSGNSCVTAVNDGGVALTKN